MGKQMVEEQKTLPNGTIYDGDWHDGKFINGKCTYPDGKI